jgi:predicted methyltransferase
VSHTRSALWVVRLAAALAALRVSALAAPPPDTAVAAEGAAARPVAAAASPGPTPATSPAAPARHLFEATTRHSFEDVDYWKSVFEDPARDAWQKPRDVITALGLRPGMSVADLGAGTGYFTHRLAPAVAPGGIVFAVETEPNLVSYLRARAEQEAQANVIPVLASFDNPRLPPAAVDLVLVVDTFHHIDQRLGYFQRLSGVLRPGGRIAIIDWRIDRLPVGPPPDHKIAREQVIAEMEAAGYRLVDERPTLLPYHYFLVFQPS